MTLTQLQLPTTPPPTSRTLHVFDGETFSPAKDAARLTRQLDRVRALMADGRERTLRQIAEACECSEGSAGARLRDLEKAPPLGCNAKKEKRRDEKIPGLWWYWIRYPA